MVGEGESNQQFREGVMNRIAEKRLWGDVTGGHDKINRMVLKLGHFQHLHVSKEVPTWHHYGEISQTLSRKSTRWSASPRWLSTYAHTMGSKHHELEICVQSRGYHLFGIVEM